jgi:GNAT superfamily N-acetyltransferase
LSEVTLIDRVADTTAAYLAIGCEVFEAEGARFVRHRDWPLLYDANHVSHVRCQTEAELDRLLARMDVEFAGCSHRRLDLDPATPSFVSARLTLDGFAPDETLEFVLEGELRATPRPADIREITTDAGWAAYAELQEMDFRETRARQGQAFNPEVAAAFLEIKRSRMGVVRYWLAHVDGVPRAYFASWPGENGVGIVEDLFTHPEFRHRGLATSLIAHCVADARARGAGPVVIGADPSDTPKRMYADLGFRPLLVARRCERHLQVPEPRL